PCREGTQQCTMDSTRAGSALGACEGSVIPQPDVCDGMDNNCDGHVDERCTCLLGRTRVCYTGPPSTEHVGACHPGTQRCVPGSMEGSHGSSRCMGQVVPGAEVCDNVDNDCNGSIDDGCNCPLGTSRPCYDAPAETLNVGACHGGTQMCVAGITQGSHWGLC